VESSYGGVRVDSCTATRRKSRLPKTSVLIQGRVDGSQPFVGCHLVLLRKTIASRAASSGVLKCIESQLTDHFSSPLSPSKMPDAHPKVRSHCRNNRASMSRWRWSDLHEAQKINANLTQSSSRVLDSLSILIPQYADKQIFKDALRWGRRRKVD
jgi:hypothetical protein